MRPDVRGDIRSVVAPHLLDAAAQAGADERLTLVGHSLGDVILYDILTDPVRLGEARERLARPFRADLLLTFGSQVGYFEEIKALGAIDPDVRRPRKVPRPTSVNAWWDVFDRTNVFSFLAESLSQGWSTHRSTRLCF